MKLKDPEGWAKSVEVNGNDPHDYGGVVTYFAEAWANLMEEQMAQGKKLENIASSSEKQIDKDLGQYGLTGFQYGCAVSILSQVWEYGEELRRWHNLKTQIGNEGEKANERGTVLNPALLNTSQ